MTMRDGVNQMMVALTASRYVRERQAIGCRLDQAEKILPSAQALTGATRQCDALATEARSALGSWSTIETTPGVHIALPSRLT
eukprot:COSAG04_NODE_22468_length_354_cov_1.015686_1_plen_82_part_01